MGVVKELFQYDKVDVNIFADDGTTALWQASQNGNVDVVKALLQYSKVNVNLRECATGTTALVVASQNGHVESSAS